MNKIELYNGDCLQVMDELIERGVKVDAIITDPPYGIIKNIPKNGQWDTIINFEQMWLTLLKLLRLLKLLFSYC